MQKTNSTQSGHVSSAFMQKYGASVTGILSGFDRLRLRGTLRALYQPPLMMENLFRLQGLLKDFKAFAGGLTARVREAAHALAQAAGRPYRYLPTQAGRFPKKPWRGRSRCGTGSRAA